MSFTRTEQFLDGIASGASVPAPFTREEQYLQKIIEKVEELEAEISGGGGGAEDYIAEVSTSDMETFTSTVTLSDLQTAYSAGKNLKLKLTTPFGELWGYLAQYTSTAVKFMIVVDDAGLVTCDSNGWSL